MINNLTSQHSHILSMPNTTPNQEKSKSLVVPNQLRPLNENNYPDILHWHKDSWIKHIDEQREHGKSPSRLRFLTDNNGNPVTEARIKMFMSTIKQAWNELYHL